MRGLLLLSFIVAGCTSASGPAARFSTTSEPVIFEPGNISTPAGEVRLTISPDGRRLLFGTMGWTGGAGGWDLFECVRTPEGWSRPAPVGFNSPEKDFDPSFAADGRGVYFFSNRPGGHGGDDLYFAPLSKDDGWGPAQNLGSNVNTPKDEWAPVVSSEGKRLLFSSNGHRGSGGHDLFISSHSSEGWGVPANLGAGINTTGEDFDATFLHDGKRIVYTSGRFETNDVKLYAATIGSPSRELLTINDPEGWNFGPSITGSEPGVLYITLMRAPGQADIYRVNYQ